MQWFLFSFNFFFFSFRSFIEFKTDKKFAFLITKPGAFWKMLTSKVISINIIALRQHCYKKKKKKMWWINEDKKEVIMEFFLKGTDFHLMNRLDYSRKCNQIPFSRCSFPLSEPSQVINCHIIRIKKSQHQHRKKKDFPFFFFVLFLIHWIFTGKKTVILSFRRDFFLFSVLKNSFSVSRPGKVMAFHWDWAQKIFG